MSLDRQTDVRPSLLTSALPGIPGEISDGCFSSCPGRKRGRRNLFSVAMKKSDQNNTRPKSLNGQYTDRKTLCQQFLTVNRKSTNMKVPKNSFLSRTL